MTTDEIREVVETNRAFGNKAYISTVVHDIRSYTNQSEAEIKALLLSMHRAGQVTLSRADLVSVHDSEVLKASRVVYLNADFHFVAC